MNLDRDQTRALRLGGEYAATLAAVEHAFMTGDDTELHRLLDPVDRIEARLVANELQALWRLANALPEPDRAGPTGVVNGGPQAPSPDASTGDSSRGDGDQSSGPTYPQITHGGDQWSRKAPCA